MREQKKLIIIWNEKDIIIAGKARQQQQQQRQLWQIATIADSCMWYAARQQITAAVLPLHIRHSNNNAKNAGAVMLQLNETLNFDLCLPDCTPECIPLCIESSCFFFPFSILHSISIDYWLKSFFRIIKRFHAIAPTREHSVRVRIKSFTCP